MIDWWWSWLLGIGTIIGLWWTGNHERLGWVMLLGMNALWVVYALTSHQYGFLLGAVATSVVHVRNYWKWMHE